MKNARLSLLVVCAIATACRTTDQPSSSSTPSTASSSPSSTTMAPPSTTTASSGPKETDVTWRSIRWDMDRAAAAEALRSAGLTDVSDKGPTKSPASWVSANLSPTSHVAVYFDEKGSMNQIVVTSTKIPEADAPKLRASLEERFGKPSSDRRTVGKIWRLPSGAHVSGHVRQEETGWSLREELGRGAATGPAGVLDLAWGQARADVEAKLKASGFAIKVLPAGPDPCTLPNAPHACGSGDPSVSLEITKTEGSITQTGTLSISKTRGLTQISLQRSGYAETKAALADLDALKPPSAGQVESERSQSTVWRPGKGEVTLDAKLSAETWSTIETYRPRVRSD